MNAVTELLHPIWLPAIVAATAALLLVLDSLLPMTEDPSRRGRALGIFACLALVVLFDLTFVFPSSGEMPGGVWKADAWSLFVQRLVLGAALLGALGSLDDVAEKMRSARASSSCCCCWRSPAVCCCRARATSWC